MKVTLVGMDTLAKPQPSKAPVSILITLSGIVICVSFAHWKNVAIPMEVKPFGMLTLDRLVQPLKAASPMLVIVLGMTTLVT